MKKNLVLSLIILTFLTIGCVQVKVELTRQFETSKSFTPHWTHEAVWYQIFPERFRNGDPSNDPDIESLDGTWPYDKQESWSVMPWGDDWYKLQPWEEANGRGFYYNGQLRRYGGDLNGIIEKLDYLTELGVNALYLNPIFESPSLHKYGCVYYHHVDNNFGGQPETDEALWEQEDPGDPATWVWTTADQEFLRLIEEVHARGMKIIIDGVFNHVGIPFWALQDVREKGPESEYVDWFTIHSFDDPSTPEDEFDYEGWYGIKDLPELKEDDQGLIQPVRDHLHAVVRRWMDPNDDGDPSDGIDGWRLDVAEKVNIRFWKEFRTWVDDINPNAYITGEIWWEDFGQNKMFNAAPWLEGDAFHSVMNYRFGDAVYRYLIWDKKQISAEEFSGLIRQVIEDYGYETVLQLQNVIDSHDNERLASACVNPDLVIDHDSNVQYNSEYQVRKPNSFERQVQRQVIGMQFLMPGTPYIYYGDEVGMWGADDPDERKPMVWSDIEYEMESHHPFGAERGRDPVNVDISMLQYYKGLIKLRKSHPALTVGDYHEILIDDERGLFAFERAHGDDRVLAVFNGSRKPVDFRFGELNQGDLKNWNPVFSNVMDKMTEKTLPAKSFRVYVRK